MKLFEGITLWISVALFLLSIIAYLVAIFFNKNKLSELAYRLIFLGFVSLILTITFRWISTGHPPVYGVYEFSLNKSLAVVIVFLLISKKYENLKILGAGIAAIMLFMLGHGMLSGTTQGDLSAPFKSNWLWVHVGFGQLSYGCFIISAVIAVCYLLKDRASLSDKKVSDIYLKLPELSVMDDLILKFVSLGFVGQTGMMVSGSIWASSLWGSYWSWEPLQTWSLVTWAIYGVFLHLRLTLGWKGRRAAWMSLIALIGIIFTYWGVGIISSQHTRVL